MSALYQHWIGTRLLCTKCGEYKETEEFLWYENKYQARGGYHYNCKACLKVYADAKRALNKELPDQTKVRRGYHIKSKYGLSMESYESMLTEQADSCAICKDSFTESKLPRVDHNHRTGRVRGLLCHSCNTAIGHLKDDPTILKAAIEYMEKDLTDFLSIMRGEM